MVKTPLSFVAAAVMECSSYMLTCFILYVDRHGFISCLRLGKLNWAKSRDNFNNILASRMGVDTSLNTIKEFL